MNNNIQQQKSKPEASNLITFPDIEQNFLFSQETEQALLGAVIVNPSKFPLIQAIVRDSSVFYMKKHTYIWDAIVYVYEKSKTIDIHALSLRLNSMRTSTGDNVLELILPSYLTDLINVAPSAKNAEIYARLVNILFVRRGIDTMILDTHLLNHKPELELDQVIAFMTRRLEWIKSKINDGDMRYSSAEFAERIGEELVNGEEGEADRGQTGATTGFRDLTKLIGRYFPEEVTYICAPPKFGKTTFVLASIFHQLMEGEQVLYVPLEMTKKQITTHYVSMLTGISLVDIKTRNINPDQVKEILEATAKIAKWKLIINDDNTELTPTQAEAVVIQAKAKYGKLDSVWVDGLWLMEPDKHFNDRRDAIRSMVAKLAKIAKDQKIPLQVVHQFNRNAEMRAEKRGGLAKARPMLTDISESSAVEKYANVIIGLFRESRFSKDEWASDDVEVHIIANRQGESRVRCTLKYDKKHNNYVDMPNVSIERGGNYD